MLIVGKVNKDELSGENNWEPTLQMTDRQIDKTILHH